MCASDEKAEKAGRQRERKCPAKLLATLFAKSTVLSGGFISDKWLCI